MINKRTFQAYVLLTLALISIGGSVALALRSNGVAAEILAGLFSLPAAYIAYLFASGKFRTLLDKGEKQ